MKHKTIISIALLSLILLVGCNNLKEKIGTREYCQYTTPAKVILKNSTELICEGFDNGVSCGNYFDKCMKEINYTDFSKCDFYLDIKMNLTCISDNNECGRCMIWQEN